MCFEDVQRVIAQIHNNMYSFMSAIPTDLEAKLIDDDGVVLRYSGIPAPFFNGVISTRLTEGKLVVKIREIQAFIRSKKVPLLWWVFPDDQPITLAEALQAQGFVKFGELPAMVLELAELNLKKPEIAGFEVVMIENPDNLGDWCKVMMQAAGMPEDIHEQFTKFYLKTAKERGEDRVHYLGLYEGRPVATCVINLTTDGVAGVYNVTTRPEVRKKGIGRAITLQPLLEAKKMGYQTSILGSSELGYNVYQSLGFKVYGKILHYLWQG